VITLFERAKKIGLTTSLDVQWDPSEKWDFDFRKILPNVDLFLPNETEFHHIAGIDGFDEALEIYKPYINNVVIKRGTDGSTLRLKSGELIQKAAYLNLDVVDAIGAGDSFNAGFIHYFLQGKSLAECQDYGSLTGAVSTTQSGGTAAFENMEETCILIEKFRNKLK
jgi:sugar/nucleoside kinase (ribokinase family)